MFYQKYRPKSFSDVFGNEDIVKSLKQLVKSKNLPHAFLFYGPRGTGKTTMARLLAKSLVCENYQKIGEICNKCQGCTEVSKGVYPDLIELDAASNNSVENIRDINQTVALSPSRGKLKFYIIDEVHMLSKGAFNALLKTLEEPPKNTYFVLATTEEEKVIDTIKSRCTQYQFKRAGAQDVVKKLQFIASEEGFKIEKADLQKIALASRGGFRDAETMLQSVIVGGLAVDEVLNSIGFDFVVRFFDAILANNSQLAIELINNIYKQGKNLESFNKEVLYYLRQVVLLKNDLNDLVELNDGVLKLAKNQSDEFSISLVLKCLKAFNTSMQNLKLAYIPTLPLEMAVLEVIDLAEQTSNKSTDKPQSGGTNQLKIETAIKTTTVTKDVQNVSEEQAEDIKNVINDLPKNKPSNKAKSSQQLNNKLPSTSKPKQFKWGEYLNLVEEKSASLVAILNVVSYEGFNEDTLILKAKYAFHKDRINLPTTKQILIDVLCNYLGKKANIDCLLSAKQKQNLTDKNVEYITISSNDLPEPIKRESADDFSIPEDDESFVASPVTVEKQAKQKAKANPSDAIDEFSGEFTI